MHARTSLDDMVNNDAACCGITTDLTSTLFSSRVFLVNDVTAYRHSMRRFRQLGTREKFGRLVAVNSDHDISAFAKREVAVL